MCTYMLLSPQETGNSNGFQGRKWEIWGLEVGERFFTVCPSYSVTNPTQKLSGLKQQSCMYFSWVLGYLTEPNRETHPCSMMSVVFPLSLPLFHLADILG